MFSDDHRKVTGAIEWTPGRWRGSGRPALADGEEKQAAHASASAPTTTAIEVGRAGRAPPGLQWTVIGQFRSVNALRAEVGRNASLNRISDFLDAMRGRKVYRNVKAFTAAVGRNRRQ